MTCEKKPKITIARHAPFIATGIENFFDGKGNRLETKPVMALCRCNESKKFPYCDGSHAEKGLDCCKLPDRPKDQMRAYVGTEITIHFNLGVCSHHGYCLELPAVFDLKRRPWINPDGAPVEEIIRTIERCPSGALAYTDKNGVYHDRLDRPPAIRITRRGPFEITGGIILETDDGSKPQCDEHYCLCRCNKTRNQPFCDGSHLPEKLIR